MKARGDGFTLLEVTVALAVFGLLLLSLSQGVHFGLLAWRTQARLAAANADLNEVDLALRNLIEAMDPGTVDQDRPTLLARRDAMTFVTDLPAAGGSGPPVAGGSGPARHVEATLLVDARHRLVLRWRDPTNVVTGTPPPRVETQILAGVAKMELAFWRPNTGWVDGWGFNSLPAMVRIHLVFVNDRVRRWPDIVVAPSRDRM
jgi:general secretion pathway protein J